MEEYYCKRSGQIPTFGNWEYANELPITQYFESARQYTSSSADSDHHRADFYTVDSLKSRSSRSASSTARKTRMREKRCTQIKEQKRQAAKVRDAMEPPNKHCHHQYHSQYDVVSKPHSQSDVVSKPHRLQTRPPNPKPVDEDLYKIPPQLLHTTKSKRKKMLGFFSRCLVPACSL